jgi:hypothetical protein
MQYWVVVFKLSHEPVIRERFQSIVVVASSAHDAIDDAYGQIPSDAEVLAVIPTGD